jgi:opacity protein-like surface antigen
MKKSMLIVSLMVAALLLVGARAQAAVLFDGVPTNGGYGYFSGLYQGFNWSTDASDPSLLVVTQAQYNSFYGNNVTFPDAGGNAASNNGANTVTLTAGNGGQFVFNGAQFWSWTTTPWGATTPDRGTIARGAAAGTLR